MDVVVLGEHKLDSTAADLLREGRSFQRRVSTATGRAVRRVYYPTLVGMVPRYMPSGYGPELAADLKVSTSVRFSGIAPGVTAKVSAPTGGPSGRAVKALEAGRLKHPVFARGPRATWTWAKRPQRIPAGFASQPLKVIRPQIRREIEQELDEIRRDVERT